MARTPTAPLHGDLQIALMHILWRKGRATVEDCRKELPPRFRKGAYTTVQTVLNRLAERGLVRRERAGRAFYYEPKISEADYYSGSLRQTLAPVSEEARRSVLVQLAGEFDSADLDFDQLAEEVERKRKK